MINNNNTNNKNTTTNKKYNNKILGKFDIFAAYDATS